MRGHPTGGEWKDYVGHDPHGVGTSPQGTTGKDHVDHRVVAGKLDVKWTFEWRSHETGRFFLSLGTWTPNIFRFYPCVYRKIK